MSVAALVPLEEYLGKSYEPDCEYVDGSIVERNVGEYFHSLLQSLVVMHLNNLREVYGVKFRAIVEQRVRVRFHKSGELPVQGKSLSAEAFRVCFL